MGKNKPIDIPEHEKQSMYFWYMKYGIVDQLPILKKLFGIGPNIEEGHIKKIIKDYKHRGLNDKIQDLKIFIKSASVNKFTNQN